MSPVALWSGGKFVTRSKLHGVHFYHIRYPKMCQRVCSALPKYPVTPFIGRSFTPVYPNSIILSITYAGTVDLQVAVRWGW